MRRKRKPKYGRICTMILIMTLFITGAYKIGSHFLSFVLDRSLDRISMSVSDWEHQTMPSVNAKESISPNALSNNLYSPYAILLNIEDEGIDFEARSEERIYPASLTKIMTAIVAIENIRDLEESIILPEEIFSSLYAANASMAGFLPGEEIPIIDLLYGTLLPSGADASMGLAFRTAGSEREFVKLMNEKANQLGMKNTHFSNVTGLHDDNHYTTVKDIATLLSYALKNEIFRQVFTSESYYTTGTMMHPGGFTLYSTMSKDLDHYEFDGGRILGGKTGYTNEAGLCLASLAEKNGTEYILVTAGAAGNHYTEPYHIQDAFTVYEKISLFTAMGTAQDKQ